MDNSTAQRVDEIARQIGMIAHEDWERRIQPEFLELIEAGEEWVEKMRKLVDDYEANERT
jgi:hypothetical protein